MLKMTKEFERTSFLHVFSFHFYLYFFFLYFSIVHLVHLFSCFSIFHVFALFHFFLEIFINAISNRQQRIERQRQRETETARGKETNSKETPKEVSEIKKSERPLKILFFILSIRCMCIFYCFFFSFYFFPRISLTVLCRQKQKKSQPPANGAM